MKKLTYLFAIVFLIISSTSCSKDDSSPSDQNNSILTSKSWVVQSKIISPSVVVGGFTVTDLMTLESEEVQKYSFKYNDDGTLYQYDISNNLIFQTTWTMNSAETQITFKEPITYTYPIVGEMGITTITIQSISSSKMVATIPAFYDGTNYLLTITFI